MEASDQLHVPDILTPGKKRFGSHEIGDGWAPEPFWTSWRREKSVVSAGDRPRQLGHEAGSPFTAQNVELVNARSRRYT